MEFWLAYSHILTENFNRVLTYSVYSTTYVHDAYYTFCVKPGSYYIVIESLSDFVTSPFKQGSNPSIDSDLDNSNGPFSSYVLKGLSRDLYETSVAEFIIQSLP
ncbi:MAG: hypothetical protein U0T81_10570 [Saprospiraceae bacterium]